MTINQIELLVGIQALVLACRDQTGHRAYCEVQAWDHGGEWITVRVLDAQGDPLLGSTIAIGSDSTESRVTGLFHVETLEQQRDELAEFIATHRKQEAA